MHWPERQNNPDWVRGPLVANIVVAAARPGLLSHPAAERNLIWAIRSRFAASQIGVAAEKLNTLLASAQQSLPQITQISQQATVVAKAVVNHAFRLWLVLIGVLGMVSVLGVLACRRLGRKTAPCGPPATTKAE